MKILVLGSAGHGARSTGQARGRQDRTLRTQRSVAVSADGDRWVLLNASSDISQQWHDNPRLQAGPLAGVVLMDAQLDHVAGLLGLRDGPPLDLFATPAVFEDLTNDLPLLNVLDSYCGIRWHMMPVAGDCTATEFRVAAVPQLRFTAMAIPGGAPHYRARRRAPIVGDRVALQVMDLRDGRRLFYAPGLTPAVANALRPLPSADCLMVGAAPRDNAPPHGGTPPTDAPMIDPAALLRASAARRKVLIHLDEADPARDKASQARRALDADGIEVAYDGMEIEL
jgi:pyrroloquinoline quinone biosynthesis protein B